MANYLIKESTLKSIADDVRTMQGSTSSMTASEMATQLSTASNNISNEITTQTDLITQIKTALEGKAGSSSGSGSVKTFSGVLNVTNGVFNVGFEPDVMYAVYTYDPTDFLHDSEILSCWAVDSGIFNDLKGLQLYGGSYGVQSFCYNKNGNTIMSLGFWDGNTSLTKCYIEFITVATCFSNFSISENGLTIVDGDNLTGLNANGNYYVYAIKYS